jgi:hypothetical protein
MLESTEEVELAVHLKHMGRSNLHGQSAGSQSHIAFNLQFKVA